LDKRKSNQQPVAYKQGLPVDSTGKLPTGEAFGDIRELKALLQRNPPLVARCIAEKLLTYGLGRGLGLSDRTTVEATVAVTRQKSYGFRAHIQEVAASEAFARP